MSKDDNGADKLKQSGKSQKSRTTFSANDMVELSHYIIEV